MLTEIRYVDNDLQPSVNGSRSSDGRRLQIPDTPYTQDHPTILLANGLVRALDSASQAARATLDQPLSRIPVSSSYSPDTLHCSTQAASTKFSASAESTQRAGQGDEEATLVARKWAQTVDRVQQLSRSAAWST